MCEKKHEKRREHVCDLQNAFQKRRRRAALSRRKGTRKGTRKEAYVCKKRHEKRYENGILYVDVKRDAYMCVTCKQRFTQAKTRCASKAKRDTKRGLCL